MKPAANVAAALLTLLVSVPAPLGALAGPGAPAGWYITGSKPGDYDFGTEYIEGSMGRQSAYIKAKPGATAGGFGTLMQTVKADNYLGQRVRVSARLKSTAADRLQLWFRIDGPDPKKSLAFYNMDDRPVTGTTDWKRYDIVLDVPPSSIFLNFGFFLSGGKGEGWADAFALETVDKSVPVSAPSLAAVNGKPFNLNFDQTVLPVRAQPTETLDGWGPFKFGMPDSEARALTAPGQAWSYNPPSPNSDRPFFRTFSYLGSRGPVNAFGTQFTSFGLAFNTSVGLSLVTLESQKRESQEDCKQDFLKLLPAVEAQYGGLAPLGNGLPQGSKVSVHQISGTKSEYRLADVPAEKGFTGGGFRTEAVRTFGPKYLIVSASDIEAPPGNSVCYTQVQFNQPRVDQ
jgi:hypothetical protein